MIMPWLFLGIILAVCLVLCAVGFYKFVYFLSIGYGFAVAGGGIAIFVIALVNGWLNSTPLLLLAIGQMALFIAYGVRLSGFLLVREIKNATYRKTLKEATGDNKKMPIFVLATIWIFCAILYAAQVSPMLFNYYNGDVNFIVTLVGMGISVLGLILESVADHQKSVQKKANPNMVATKGLYRIVRCPNYLGEIIFWTGIFVSGVATYANVGQWVIAIIAFVCIVYIMFNGAQRLEKRQMKRYGNMEEYNLYANKTPIIIPLLPIYHLNKKETEENK
jgi:steroid 5-alpha reductase family enzyme